MVSGFSVVREIRVIKGIRLFGVFVFSVLYGLG